MLGAFHTRGGSGGFRVTKIPPVMSERQLRSDVSAHREPSSAFQGEKSRGRHVGSQPAGRRAAEQNTRDTTEEDSRVKDSLTFGVSAVTPV